jgi:hypothetical protein
MTFIPFDAKFNFEQNILVYFIQMRYVKSEKARIWDLCSSELDRPIKKALNQNCTEN